MKKILSILGVVAISVSVFAQTKPGQSGRFNNRLFENAYDALPNKAEVFKVGGDWFPYPDYSDRAAWEELSEAARAAVMKKGEAALKSKWNYIPASTYIEFEKTGNRDLMKGETANITNLTAMVVAELVEGKGRFMNEIMDRCWLECTRFNWGHAAHTGRQPSHRTLPTPEWHAVTLHSTYVAASVAVAWHFFHEKWDEIDPSISQTIQKAMKTQIFDPYMSDYYAEHFHPWMGLTKKVGHAVNNWNCTCNTGVFIAATLMMQDQEELNKMIERIFLTFDNYLSYIYQDGCCDEGPSYWRMASGKFYEFSRYVNYASCGKMNVFGDKLLRKAGEYKSKTDLGDGWVVDYGDGGARATGDPLLMFRYGYDINDQEMINYAIYNSTYPEEKKFKVGSFPASEIMNALEWVRYRPMIKEAQQAALEEAGGDYDALKKKLRKNVTNVWYDQTQQAVFRSPKGWTLACKAGSNDESHNHNDCGSCILMIDTCPVLVDPGTATYTKDTFGPNRYTMWHISSLSHNVPKINGCIQQAGKEFCTSSVSCNTSKGLFSADIAGVYPKDAACTKWMRSYKLEDKKLTIRDEYSLSQRKAPDEIRFTVWGDVAVKNGFVEINTHNFKGDMKLSVKLHYSSNLTASCEEKVLEDKKMKAVWGDKLTTIILSSSADAPLSGSYEVTVSR